MTDQTSLKPRWGKGAVVLVAVAVAFLLAAGTFGTLWIFESNDHSATSEQLTASRARADEAKTKLRDAEDKRKTIGDKLQETVTEERTQEILRDKYALCAAAGQKVAKAVQTRDDAALEEAELTIDLWCV